MNSRCPDCQEDSKAKSMEFMDNYNNNNKTLSKLLWSRKRGHFKYGAISCRTRVKHTFWTRYFYFLCIFEIVLYVGASYRIMSMSACPRDIGCGWVTYLLS